MSNKLQNLVKISTEVYNLQPFKKAILNFSPTLRKKVDDVKGPLSRGKLCGASLKMRENVEKKRYNARDRAGYSATLDAAGLAALNPRVSGNGTLLLDVSRRARRGARLCV